MTEDDRKSRNRVRLGEAHPVFKDRLIRTLQRVEAEGWRPRIQACWRSIEDQQVAHDAGNSHVLWGFHNATAPDGTPEALAADVLDDDRPLDPSRDYLFALARTARAEGLNTGIDWGLPPTIRAALNLHITAGRPGSLWLTADGGPGKIGWDPTHVEIVGLSTQEARTGRRPEALDTERLA
jgi:hypothetical protein